jgi:nucleoside-diphosphate-sugar epimerase
LVSGYSRHGIAEGFTLDGARSFYGTSKLAGEQLIQEYVYSYGMRAIIDRCGVIAGPWQMGKVDQGVITLWVARHYFGRPLPYDFVFGSRSIKGSEVQNYPRFKLLINRIVNWCIEVMFCTRFNDLTNAF